MIGVKQIADLEARVLRAVELIERLRNENRTLSSELQVSETLTRKQEGMLKQLRDGEQEVEQIIVRTLSKLDGLESAWAELEDDGAADNETDEEVPAPPPESKTSAL